MRHNGERRPEEIEANIARTRGDMDATLTAIEQRLTPGQLFDQGLDYLKQSGAREFASNLGAQVKNNPMPVALMGVAIAWLMATGNRGASYSASSSYMYEGQGGEGEGRLAAMKERVSSGVSSAKDTVGSARATMKDSFTSASQSARERVGQLGQSARSQMERARHQAERVRSGYDTMVREQPLALGAIGVAIGALLAAVAPRTRKEDELMGEASDQLAQKVKETGQTHLEKAKELGKEQLEKAKEAMTGAKEKSAPGKPPPAVQPSGRPNVVEPARATPLGGEVRPKDPRLGTP